MQGNTCYNVERAYLFTDRNTQLQLPAPGLNALITNFGCYDMLPGMRRNKRIAAAAFSVLLYIAATWFIYDSSVASVYRSAPLAGEETFVSPLSDLIISTVSGTENARFPSPGMKKQLNSPPADTRVVELLLDKRLASYTGISDILIIKYRKADIIFPFDYFW